ncbi:hypothetical protein TNCT_462041 [Trichonephila clavata]|uniref:Uncharacterized protein n=1 Tax=Trichonephila clavata TaxID=2740835 RepID=A0A8X6GGN6_TRICU|nr:hypothetical protein TNCT_462041 [Trichonephila clavata]
MRKRLLEESKRPFFSEASRSKVRITPVIRPSEAPVLIARSSTALASPQPMSIPEQMTLPETPELMTHPSEQIQLPETPVQIQLPETPELMTQPLIQILLPDPPVPQPPVQIPLSDPPVKPVDTLEAPIMCV